MIIYIVVILLFSIIITFLVVNYLNVQNKVITRGIIDNLFSGTANITPRDIHAYETLIYILSKKESHRIINPSEMARKLREALINTGYDPTPRSSIIPRKSSSLLPSITDPDEDDLEEDWGDDEDLDSGRTCYMKRDVLRNKDYYWKVPEDEVSWDPPTDCNCFVRDPGDDSLPLKSWDESSNTWVTPNKCETFSYSDPNCDDQDTILCPDSPDDQDSEEPS